MPEKLEVKATESLDLLNLFDKKEGHKIFDSNWPICPLRHRRTQLAVAVVCLLYSSTGFAYMVESSTLLSSIPLLAVISYFVGVVATTLQSL
jgi:hypothetical protein